MTFMAPPSQCATSGGGPASGNGTTRMPHEPWFRTRLSTMVSFRPPAITIPVPTGPNAAEPALGTFGLLLSWMKFFRNTVHECEPFGPVPPPGHAPSCGDGASSLFWLFAEMPVLFSSHSDFSTMRWPPEFVPEYPSAEFSAWASVRSVLQSGQAPT